MIFGWTYFLILQVVVILTYFLKRKDREYQPFSKIFPTKIHYVVGNASIFTLCYLYNTERQLFCNPVPWTGILLVLFIISFLSYPFFHKRKYLSTLLAIIGGLGIFISIYLILFARWEYLIFLTFNIPIILIIHFVISFLKNKFNTNIFNTLYFYPAVILTPFFLLYQLGVQFKSLTIFKKKLFLLTPIMTLTVMVLLSLRINYIVNEINASPNDGTELLKLIENPIDRYLTELVLGAHWKYHTELCLLDGWRPPYHDPVLVSANKILSPFSGFDQGTTLANANKVYRQLFPDNRTDFDCKCAKNERLFDIR